MKTIFEWTCQDYISLKLMIFYNFKYQIYFETKKFKFIYDNIESIY